MKISYIIHNLLFHQTKGQKDKILSELGTSEILRMHQEYSEGEQVNPADFKFE